MTSTIFPAFSGFPGPGEITIWEGLISLTFFKDVSSFLLVTISFFIVKDYFTKNLQLLQNSEIIRLLKILILTIQSKFILLI